MRCCTGLLFAAALLALPGCFPVVAVGIGAGALMGADRRTSSAYLEDAKIETRVSNNIFAEYRDSVHVSVTSYNRHVLITGEASSEAAKIGVGQIVSAVPGVTGVSNELVVSGLSGLASRSNDSLVTSNVKLRFLDNKIFQPDHVKVVTENSTVYLMGLLYRKEAEAATTIASNSKGVQRIVTLFEYLD